MILSLSQLATNYTVPPTAEEADLLTDIYNRINEQLTAMYEPDKVEYEMRIESPVHWVNVSVDRFRQFILSELADANWSEYEVEPLKEPNFAGSRNFYGFYVRVKMAVP